MLASGTWRGRGSLLAEGQSRGMPVACEVRLERDDEGITVTGHWQRDGAEARELAARVAGNDVGTYTLSLRLDLESLQGTAKLDSPPNLGLLWNDAGSVHATFALFEVSGGYGCRGFVRDGARVFTWEIALSPAERPGGGDNVVSLRGRRR